MSTDPANAARCRLHEASLPGMLFCLVAAASACAYGDADPVDPGEILVGYIAPAGAPLPVSRAATFGIRLGMEEASHAARLTGGAFRVHVREARTREDAIQAAEELLDENVIALVGGFDDATCNALADIAQERRVVYVNIGCSADVLRTGHGGYVVHVEASDSMYAAAMEQNPTAGDDGVVLWHPGLERFGAGQLNDRYVRRFGEGANAPAWAGWMAIKSLWETARNLEVPDGSALAHALQVDGLEFDGHKGEALRFDPETGQLAQPLYAMSGVAGEPGSPVPVAMLTVSDPSAALRSAHARGARLAVVSNEGSHDITILDVTSMEVVATVPLGHRPRGVRLSPDGSLAYIALSDDQPLHETDNDGIVVVDMRTGVLVARHPAGSDPEQFAVSPDGDRLYSANEDAGTATITNLSDGSVEATLVVGIEPEGVAVSPDGRWVYVTAETSNTVSVIDTELDRVVTNFTVDVRPRAAVFSPDGARAYVTNEISGTMTVVDAERHAVVATVDLDGRRARPVGVVTSPDGSQVYVANGRSNTVSIVDAKTNREEAVIEVGARPWGIDITPDGAQLLTANGLSNDLSVVDIASRTVTATIPVGTRPWGVVVVP